MYMCVYIYASSRQCWQQLWRKPNLLLGVGGMQLWACTLPFISGSANMSWCSEGLSPGTLVWWLQLAGCPGIFSYPLIFQKEKLVCMLDLSLFKLMFFSSDRYVVPPAARSLYSWLCPLCCWFSIKAANWQVNDKYFIKFTSWSCNYILRKRLGFELTNR